MIKIRHKDKEKAVKIPITWKKTLDTEYKLRLTHTIEGTEYNIVLEDASEKRYEVCGEIDFSQMSDGEYIGKISDGKNSDDLLLIVGEVYIQRGGKQYNNDEDNMIYEYDESF